MPTISLKYAQNYGFISYAEAVQIKKNIIEQYLVTQKIKPEEEHINQLLLAFPDDCIIESKHIFEKINDENFVLLGASLAQQFSEVYHENLEKILRHSEPLNVKDFKKRLDIA